MGLLENLLILTVVVIIVYWIYNYFKKDNYHLSGIQAGTKSKIIKGNKLPANKTSNNYAYSVWFYVKDWQYRLTETKELLRRSSSGSGSGEDSNPNITLAPYENNINIAITTYPTHGGVGDGAGGDGNKGGGGKNSHNCTIRNFPLQKWCNLIISLNGRSLDVYIDGKLVRTCVLPGVPKINSNAGIYITPDGGFSGWTSNLQYFQNPLNPQQAYNIYKEGYGGSGFLSIFEKYKIKIAYLVDNKEEGSVEI
jgi:hypothetical protein